MVCWGVVDLLFKYKYMDIVILVIFILSVVGVAVTYKGGPWYLFVSIAILTVLRLFHVL